MKSKRTKALEIDYQTKLNVWNRQNGRSLFAPYRPITVEMCCCHYISRANGGLGEEWNIFGCYQTSWFNEHYMFDGQLNIDNNLNLTRDEMKTVVRNHLLRNYSNWSEDNCKYKKYKEISDYEVKRKY